MITNNVINTNSFVTCFVYQGPHETTSYFNDNDGHFHAAIYVAEGVLDTYESNLSAMNPDDKNVKLYAGNLYDSSPTRGKYIKAKTYDSGASVVMFNPVPADKKLNVEMVQGKQTIEITATDTRITVVCVTGPATINDKALSSMQFAVVFPGKTATLVTEEHSVCAVVTG